VRDDRGGRLLAPERRRGGGEHVAPRPRVGHHHGRCHGVQPVEHPGEWAGSADHDDVRSSGGHRLEVRFGEEGRLVLHRDAFLVEHRAGDRRAQCGEHQCRTHPDREQLQRGVLVEHEHPLRLGRDDDVAFGLDDDAGRPGRLLLGRRRGGAGGRHGDEDECREGPEREAHMHRSVIDVHSEQGKPNSELLAQPAGTSGAST
jgi:hypothetical protein